jgi:cysteinyl-tRNA synthetase
VQAKLSSTPRLVGLSGPDEQGRLLKMSKSLNNAILLSDDPETIKRKVMGRYTDPHRIRKTDPGRVENNPLWIFHDTFNEDKAWVNEAKEKYRQGQIGDVECKQKLIEDFKTRFAKDIKKDPALERFLQFAKRIIYADAPETLTEARKSQYDKAMHQLRTVEDETVPYMTLPKARAELANIEEQRAEGNPQWSHVTDGQIRALKLFYTALEREFAGDQTPPANNNTDSGPDTKSRSGPKSR